MKTEEELKAEIKEMEKLAEDFVDNKFVKLSRKAFGIDAIQDCSNFTLEYDRKIAELQTLQERNAEVKQAIENMPRLWSKKEGVWGIDKKELLQKLGLEDGK